MDEAIFYLTSSFAPSVTLGFLKEYKSFVGTHVKIYTCFIVLNKILILT